jgi:hypothetical protein
MNCRLLKALVGGAAVAGCGVVFAPSAQAQVPSPVSPVEKPIRVKIGTLIPTDDKGDATLYLGGSYDFGKSSSSHPTVYSAYLDAAFKDSDNRLVGLGASFRSYLTPPLVVTRFYAGAGIGAYFSKFGNDDDTRFGGKVFAGAEFNQGFFGEADFTLPGISEQTGVGLSLGYRF